MADVGFLEGEFERAVAEHTAAERQRNEPANSNIVHLEERREFAAQERARRFRALLDALPAAVYTTDAAGRLTYYNEAAVELWGYRPELGSAEWCGSWKLFNPDGTSLAHADCPMAVALKENRAIRGAEAIAERPDGRRVPFAPYPTPLHDETGRLVGGVNMLIDLTERKRAESEQMMLMREVHHRVRNTLAIAQAIVGSTAKSAVSIEGFKDALIGRIAALARTHLLLSDGPRTSVSFGLMVHSELDPFDDTTGDRVRIEGPAVDIPTRQAVPVGMMLHELTTNAAKYGALSTLSGRVDVSWTVISDGSDRKLEINWVESGGPMVTSPLRSGFGRQLLDFVLPRQIQGEARIDFPAEGVRVRIVLPLPQKDLAAKTPH
jgi:PAS domain S-box-containing protein